MIVYNPFQNVGFTPRFGTSNQDHIPGIESSQSTTGVGVTVTNAAKNYIVLLKLDGYSSVSYSGSVVVP